LPGSNGVQTAAGVRKLMADMKQRFPQDMDYAIALDQTRAVTEGMKEIIQTLLIAIVLVILVVYLFLQDWRATLIPMLAVPVSLVGTFILFPLFGFSINTLSMFGLVLAVSAGLKWQQKRRFCSWSERRFQRRHTQHRRADMIESGTRDREGKTAWHSDHRSTLQHRPQGQDHWKPIAFGIRLALLPIVRCGCPCRPCHATR